MSFCINLSEIKNHFKTHIYSLYLNINFKDLPEKNHLKNQTQNIKFKIKNEINYKIK